MMDGPTLVAVAFPAPGGGTRTITLTVGVDESSAAAAQRFGHRQGLTRDAVGRLAKHIESRRRTTEPAEGDGSPRASATRSNQQGSAPGSNQQRRHSAPITPPLRHQPTSKPEPLPEPEPEPELKPAPQSHREPHSAAVAPIKRRASLPGGTTVASAAPPHPGAPARNRGSHRAAAFGSSAPRDVCTAKSAAAAARRGSAPALAEAERKLEKYRAKLEEAIEVESSGGELDPGKRADYELKLELWTQEQARLAAQCHRTQENLVGAAQPRVATQQRRNSAPGRNSAPAQSAHTERKGSRQARVEQNQPCLSTAGGAATEVDWRIKTSPAVVNTGQRGGTPKRVRHIELASEVADSADARHHKLKKPSVDGMSRATRHDGRVTPALAAARAAAAAAVIAAGSDGEKVISRRLRAAKMRLREGQTPWSNTPKSKDRELQLAVTVWQRLASAVRLPWFAGDRCDTADAGYGLGTIQWVGVAPAAGPGILAGVALDEPCGAHDGEVAGRCYFRCSPDHGVLVPAALLRPLPGAAPTDGRSRDAGSTGPAINAGSTGPAARANPT